MLKGDTAIRSEVEENGITKGQSSRVQCLEDTEVRLGGTDVSSGISNTFMLLKVI